MTIVNVASLWDVAFGLATVKRLLLCYEYFSIAQCWKKCNNTVLYSFEIDNRRILRDCFMYALDFILRELRLRLIYI